jgi:hypothetical protein
MKKIIPLIAIALFAFLPIQAQRVVSENQRKELTALIDKYSQAREDRDTILLKSILTSDIDQLVSSGEWRDGVSSSVKGMLRSSGNNPGKRKLTVHKIRLIDATSAIVDCKYDIENTDGTVRNMWSTFIVIADKGVWKICAIRNMLPSTQ